MIISVPCSTANLGPGFDALGMALSITMDVEVGAATLPAADEHHSAMKAFRLGGGTGPLGVRTSIPPGKGLGYSGAGKVAGFAAAAVQAGSSLDDALDYVFEQAAEAEGHPDNAAPSAYGGLTVAAAGRVLRVPVGAEVRVVVWIPDQETSTDASRATLPRQISHADATFNVGRTALLVGGLVTGDLDAVAAACDDRLHQPYRLEAAPETAQAIHLARHAGAVAAWLSGSGPSMACLVRPDDVDAVVADLPTSAAHVKVLDIAEGARILG